MSRGTISKYPTERQEVDGDPVYRMFIGKGFCFFFKREQI